MAAKQNDAGSILDRITDLPVRKSRGRLKIFVGYAPGVGKTCAMLSDAHEEQKEGIDIVVGYIKNYARPYTAALLEGLELLPYIKISNKESSTKEFDLDQALQRVLTLFYWTIWPIPTRQDADIKKISGCGGTSSRRNSCIYDDECATD